MFPSFSFLRCPFLYYAGLSCCCCILFFLTGCASVSVDNVDYGHVTPKHLPERIYVQKFQAPAMIFHVNRKGKELNDLIEEERLQLAEDLALRLSKHVAPAVVLEDGKNPPQGNYWLLTGSFQLVNAGSRLLRAGIGFGAGKTRMDTTATLMDLSQPCTKEIATITTTGGSGMAPGAIAAFAPIGPWTLSTAFLNASGAVGGALGSGISIDSRRTAREIVAAISEYAFEHFLLNKHLHPKRPGDISPLWEH